uniref:Flavodoxin-like domain-containing protein n=1 Tax=Parastrongyloides trichosuri TaxID=131310 RepID=A0A0N4Z6Y7_PARTI
MDNSFNNSGDAINHILEVIACYVLAYMTYFLIVNRLVDLQNCKESSIKKNGEHITADYATIIERQMSNMYPNSKVIVYGYPKSSDVRGLSKLLMLNQKNFEARKKAIEEQLNQKN